MHAVPKRYHLTVLYNVVTQSIGPAKFDLSIKYEAISAHQAASDR